MTPNPSSSLTQNNVKSDALRIIAVFFVYLLSKAASGYGLVIAPELDAFFPAPLIIWMPSAGVIFGVLLGARLFMMIPLFVAEICWFLYTKTYEQPLSILFYALVNTLPPMVVALYIRKYTRLDADAYPGIYISRLMGLGAISIALLQALIYFLVVTFQQETTANLLAQFTSASLATTLGVLIVAPSAYIFTLLARPRPEADQTQIKRSISLGLKAASLPVFTALLILIVVQLLDQYIGLDSYMLLLVPTLWMVLRQTRFFDQAYFLLPTSLVFVLIAQATAETDSLNAMRYSILSVQLTILLMGIIAVLATVLLDEAKRKSGTFDKTVTQRDLLKAIDTANVGYVITDNLGVILYISPSAVTLLGGTHHSQYLNKTWWELDRSSEGLRARRVALWHETISAGINWQDTVRWGLEKGGVKYFEASATPMDQDRAILVIRDRTAMVETERKAKATENLRNLVLDTLPLSVTLQDATGEIRYSNNILPARYDQKPVDIIGKKIASLPEYQLLNAIDPIVQKVRSTGTIIEGKRIKTKLRTGQTAEWLVYITPIMVGEQIDQILIVAADRTERFKLQREKDMYAKRLSETQKMEAIQLFAGGLAHELTNIFHPIGVAARALSNNPDRPDRQKHLKLMDNMVIRAGEILHNTMQMTRGEVKPPVPSNVGQILTELISYAKQIAPKGLRYKLTLPDEDIICRLDQTELQQVMMNLLVNAAAAQEEKGLIEISLTTEIHPLSDMVCAKISVQDTGIGMDEETKDRIFEPFFTTKPAGQGTGLGLPMVRGIVSNWGGDIIVSTAPNQGSTFCVVIPIHKEEI